MNTTTSPIRCSSGKELPTFKFELEKSAGKVIGGSVGREATVEQLPISKGIAGVSMILEPGVMRELHWHATAAEWAFVIDGRVRTTVIDPQGYAETNDFEPGDIWYFPRGHGHVLVCLGDEPSHFILIFDNGYFSEFGTFSISDWIGHAPKPLLVEELRPAGIHLRQLPQRRSLLRPRPAPVGHNSRPTCKAAKSRRRRTSSACWPSRRTPIHKGGREWRVDSTRFPISTTITGVVLDLEPGGLRELHWHPTSDEWQYVIEGQVSVTMFGSHGRFRTETLERGRRRLHPARLRPLDREHRQRRPAAILIGFNTGHYEAIDLSQWIAGNPVEILATNFGQPASVIEKFPKKRVFIAPE